MAGAKNNVIIMISMEVQISKDTIKYLKNCNVKANNLKNKATTF